MMARYKNDNSIAMIFIILWSIWNARNDLLFDGKHKAPFQVLHATQALLNTWEVELRSMVVELLLCLQFQIQTPLLLLTEIGLQRALIFLWT
jgi:hypothetical protein